jgi:hypothetical protein
LDIRRVIAATGTRITPAGANAGIILVDIIEITLSG